MNRRLVTDIRKEATSARPENLDDATQPNNGQEFAPRRRRSPEGTAPRRRRACPHVGHPPPRDLAAVVVASRGDGHQVSLRGIWHVGRFRLGRRVNGCPTHALATQCDCNLHSSRAQFGYGANRVFYKQIDAL
jgi:hypothetical protein